MRRKVTKISAGLFAALLLTGCLGTRYLEKDQKLLYNQSIQSPKGFDASGLNDIYVQKANRRLLGLPINSLTWMYHLGFSAFNKETSWLFSSKNDFIRKKEKKEKRFNDKIAAAKSQRKINNLTFRKQQKLDDINFKIENGNNPMQWGERVSVYDSSAVIATNEKIENYMFNHGHFMGKSNAILSEKKKRVSIQYVLNPGLRFVYDTIIYRIADTAVLHLMRRYESQSKIRKGDRYDQKNLTDERDRIDLLMKNHGYYDFSKQYIDYQIDTTYGHHHAIAIRISISDPAIRNNHKTFAIDSVSFTTDASTKRTDSTGRKSVLYHDIRFNYFKDLYSKKILANRVFLYRDSLYSRTNTFLTQRQLANLDIFKFVNINYDTIGGKFIANIFTSPLDRYSWTNEAGVTVTQGYPGPYYSLSFKKRNIFHGLEIFELNGRFGFEGVAGATEIGTVYKSTEANINMSVTFPQFLLPLGKAADKLGKFNPKTRLLTGYTYTDRPEYQRANATIAATYTWEGRKRTQYSFTLVNFQVIQSTTRADFQQTLEDLQTNQGNNLIYSFKPSLVSSMIFSMTWNPNNSYGLADRSAFFMRIQAEAGGTMFNFLTPSFATEDPVKAASEGLLQLYKYVRLGFDFRRKQVIDKNTSLAFRFNSGVAYSYGTNTALPYEKYFFAGGSNSLRAWRPRRLGIGSFPTQLSTNPAGNGLFDYRYEKPGEILIEASVEWRKKLFGFVDGAIFIDAGNVWSFQQAKTPPASETVAPWTDQGNSKFYFDKFLKEIAIGTGFGLRFDFNFLVLRLDVGIKAWDPSRAEGDRFVLNHVAFSGPYGVDKEPVIYNIAIGYPF